MIFTFVWFEVHTPFRSCCFCPLKFFVDEKCFCRGKFLLGLFALFSLCQMFFCTRNSCLKPRHEADSFEPAEWSERLPSRRSGWLGAAAAGSIPAFSTFFSILFLFFQRQHSSSAREITSLLALFSCLSLSLL